MVTAKYHNSPSGPKQCQATKRPCKYAQAGKDHYTTREEAQAAFAKEQGGSFAPAAVSTVSKQPLTPEEATPEQVQQRGEQLAAVTNRLAAAYEAWQEANRKNLLRPETVAELQAAHREARRAVGCRLAASLPRREALTFTLDMLATQRKQLEKQAQGVPEALPAAWVRLLPSQQLPPYKPLTSGDYSTMGVEQFREEAYAIHKRGRALQAVLRQRKTDALVPAALAYGEAYGDDRYKRLCHEPPSHLSGETADAREKRLVERLTEVLEDDLHSNAEERWAHGSHRWAVEGRVMRDPATPLGERRKIVQDQVRELKNFEDDLTKAINSAASAPRQQKAAAEQRLQTTLKTAARVLSDGGQVTIAPEAYRDILRSRREEAEAVAATLPPLAETQSFTARP